MKKGVVALVERYGADLLSRYFAELIDYTERLVRAEIRSWPDGEYSFTDYLDDDGVDAGEIPIKVTMRVAGDSLVVDFTGTSPQVKGAINSPISFYDLMLRLCGALEYGGGHSKHLRAVSSD